MASIVKRGNSWHVRIRRKGTGVDELTRTFKGYGAKQEAEAWAAENETKLLKGMPVFTAAGAKFTFQDAVTEYRAHHKNIPRPEGYRLTQIVNDMGELAVSRMTPLKFSAYISALSEAKVKAPSNKKKPSKLYNGDEFRTYADSTVRKAYFTIKKLLAWHSTVKGYPMPDIFSTVKPPATDIKRTRRLVDDEEIRLLAACDKMYVNQEELKTIIQVALETGMRAGELLSIVWNEVKPEKRSIQLPKEKTKTSRYREVPMTTVCVELLRKHRRTANADDPRVFWQWKNSDTLGHRFRVLCKNANLQDFRFHDLRHEATSRFFERTTLRDIEIAKITGHSDMRTLMRYANLRSEDLAKMLW